MITKTKIKKAVAVVALSALLGLNGGQAFATVIGTGTVTGNPGLTVNVDWNDTFTAGSASGTVTGIQVTARVVPTLNMVVSADTIALGDLAAGVPSNGTVNLEIGTNAADGVNITATSTNGGLQNASDAGIQIDNHTADGVTEDYTFASVGNVTDDSSYTAFALDGDSNLATTQVADNTTNYKIYGTNKPEDSTGTDDVVFTVSATSNAQTAAGDYSDTITFTVTGNF